MLHGQDVYCWEDLESCQDPGVLGLVHFPGLAGRGQDEMFWRGRNDLTRLDKRIHFYCLEMRLNLHSPQSTGGTCHSEAAKLQTA